MINIIKTLLRTFFTQSPSRSFRGCTPEQSARIVFRILSAVLVVGAISLLISQNIAEAADYYAVIAGIQEYD